jgi:hypothetical protein
MHILFHEAIDDTTLYFKQEGNNKQEWPERMRMRIFSEKVKVGMSIACLLACLYQYLWRVTPKEAILDITSRYSMLRNQSIEGR